MFSEKMVPTRARDDFEDFKKNRYPKQKGSVIKFVGTDGLDVYNTSVPFNYKGKRVIAGRVEARNSEDSTTMFFEQIGNEYVLMKDAKKIEGLQDPFVTIIDGSIVLGGVHAVWRDDGSLVTYHTDFFNIDDLSCPVHLLQGPDNMKDVRLVQLPDKRVCLFSRPNGEPVKKYNKIAAVGFEVFDSLKEITTGKIAEARLIEWIFCDDEWGGFNQLHILKNGLVGIIGHKSWGSQESFGFNLHYYSFAAAINPDTREITPIKVISTRECFPDGDNIKHPRVADVCFTSGIERMPNGKAILYSGLSDSAEGYIEIDDPFIEYEK